MTARQVGTAASVVLFPVLLVAGSCRLGSLPALGGLLDPANGVWAAVRTAELPDSTSGSIPGLARSVRVVYDDRAVPHIFGESIDDVTAALGYVVARDRLFQLDLQTRATAGTLAELVGRAALPVDRDLRRLDLAGAAERNFADLPAGGTDRARLNAFARGVNAWLDQLAPRDYPFEYKLLGGRPARWEPVHSVYLMKRMGWTLSYVDLERRRLAAAARVGWEAADALFPVHAPIQEPIQTNGRRAPRFESVTFPPPGRPDTVARTAVAVGGAFGLTEPSWVGGEDVVGSNNWAVGPTRTRDGHAIVAGDPHLGLSLPSVWYEVHLVVPDSLDVYGVTLPGAPGVIIGFNRDVAWSFTNTGADVMDFYVEEVDDPESPTRYRVDGDWRMVRRKVETYRGRGGNRVLATDTLHYTHRGPLTRRGDQWWSLRWTVLEDQGEQAAFRAIATARTVDEWLAGMASFLAPAQNGIVADRNGSIAIRSHGRFPIRGNGAPGHHVQDGTNSESDWTGAWPVSRYPFSIDPGQGFLASANQQPIDPRADPGYLGADWPSPWRAIRINTLLREHDAITPDDVRRFQTDPGSARADLFAPALIAAARRRLAGDDNQDLRAGLQHLERWPRTYDPDNTGAVLFERAMRHLAYLVWDELEADDTLPSVRPGSAVLATLLADSASLWWDRLDTDAPETRDEIVAESVRYAYASLREDLGPPGNAWAWREHRVANIRHLLRIDALSAIGVPVQGGPSTLAPSSGDGGHGPSWRMVVELGTTVRAWAVYPGGQSGNPVSSRYDDRVAAWSSGALDEVLFPKRDRDLPAGRTLSVLHLSGT